MSKRILVGALGAACLITTPAVAQTTAEKCPAKVIATDAAGDSRLFNQAPVGPANADIVEGAIRHADRRVTAIMKIPGLDKTVPAYSTGVSWYFEYTFNGQALFVSAQLTPDGQVRFTQGTDGQSYSETGTTTGRFNAGSPGTIELDLPGLTSATRNYELTANRFVSYAAIGAATPAGTFALLPGADEARGDDHTTTPCSTATTPPAG
jgi:hypothetical protein